MNLRESEPSRSRVAPPLGVSAQESDEQLARRAQEGSLAAFGTLVDRYEARLIGFLTQRSGNRAEAHDLAQDTFIRAWSRISTFDAERRFSTWIFTIAARLGADHHRRLKRERAAHEQIVRNERTAHTAAKESGAEHSDIWEVARATLTDDQMQAMWLRYVMEMQISDIAETLGRSRVGTRVLLFRARERIAAVMTESGTIDRPGKDAAGRNHRQQAEVES